jgi:hypothetical protein
MHVSVVRQVNGVMRVVTTHQYNGIILFLSSTSFPPSESALFDGQASSSESSSDGWTGSCSECLSSSSPTGGAGLPAAAAAAASPFAANLF